MAESGAYASALGNLRDTVKWIIAAFTGGSAIIFSGLTVTSISALAQSRQWLLPVGLAAVPVVAAVGAIAAALRVINVTPPAPGALFTEYGKAINTTGQEAIGDNDPIVRELPSALGAYGTREEFDRRLRGAFDTVKTTQEAYTRNADNPNRRTEYENALTRFDALQPTTQNALNCAAWVRARGRYRMANWEILAAAVVAVAGMAASGIITGYQIRGQHDSAARAVNAASPKAVPFTEPTSVHVWFTGPPPAAARGPHGCPVWNGISALAVGGTESRPLLLFPGYTASEARRHGMDLPTAQCAAPWLWPTRPGQVLAVPR